MAVTADASPDPACPAPGKAVPYADTGDIQRALAGVGEKPRSNMAGRQGRAPYSFHLRRRLERERLFFEVEGPDAETCSKRAFEWAQSGVARIRTLQDRYLEKILDLKERACLAARMPRLRFDDGRRAQVETVRPSAPLMGLGAAAFVWLILSTLGRIGPVRPNRPDGSPRFIMRGLWLLAAVLSLTGVWVAPWHLTVALLFVVLLLLVSRKRGLGPWRRFLDKAPFMAPAVVALLAAFGWRAWLLPGAGAIRWSPPLLLVVLGLLVLLQRLRPSGAASKHTAVVSLALALPLFALTASAAAWLWPLLPEVPGEKALVDLAGVVVEGRPALFPAWLTGGADFTPRCVYALSAWTLCFGGWLFLSAAARSTPSAAWTPKICAAYLLVALLGMSANVVGLLADWGSLDDRFPGGVCEITTAAEVPHSAGAGLGRLERLALGARRQSLAIVERDALSRGTALALMLGQPGRAAVMAARAATLDPVGRRHLLVLAASLWELGSRKAALNLFRPEAVPDEALAKATPCRAGEAHFLSEVWRGRNDLFHVVGVLRPFVRPPKDRDRVETDLKAPLPLDQEIALRYGDYCLYSGDLACAEEVADAFLALRPDYLRALNLKGEVLYERDEIARAFPFIYRASNLEPYNIRVIGNLAAIYALMGDEKAAYPLQRRLIMEFTSSAWEGKQGNKLYLPGEAYLQGDFVPGLTEMGVKVFGSEARGEWPRLELWVNGEKVEELDIIGDEPAAHRFEITLRRGPNRIAVRFPNDYGDDFEDRNLFVGPGFFRPILYLGKKR